MTSKTIIAVGVVTDSWTFFAKQAPDCVKVWTLDEEEQTVLVGTTFKEIPSGAIVNLQDLDQTKALEFFKDYAAAVRKLSQNDFNSEHDFQQWNLIFSTSAVDVVIFSE